MDIGIIVSYPLLALITISTLTFIFCRKDYYFVYNHRLLFVVGLVFSRSLTYYAVVYLLMWYFTDHGVGFVRSAVLANIQESLSSLSVIFMAHLADSFVGPFRTLVFSTTAYIGGVMLFLMFNPYDVTWLVVIVLALLALGKSGDSILEYVLIDLVHGFTNQSEAEAHENDDKRSHARAAVWWRIAHASGSISAIMWVTPSALGGPDTTWNTSFMVCLISMTTTLIIFCRGHNVYYQGELVERPIEIFFRVFRARLQKLFNSKSRYSIQERSPQNKEPEKDDATKQEISQFHLDTNVQKNRGGGSYEEDMKVVRNLLRMFPMWGLFLVVSLTSAAGSTFYIEQYSNLENKHNIPILMYNLIQDFSSFSIPFLYNWTCLYRNQKLKIGVGMLCSIVSCIFAWRVEVRRREEVNILGGGEDAATSISFLWLVPQFFMLGCMEGLTEDGVLRFFKSHMDQPRKSYGDEYMEVVMGFGKVVNIILILILKSKLHWFGKDVNNGTHLDNYYLLLVVVCSVNLIIYCCIVTCYYKDTKQDQNPRRMMCNNRTKLISYIPNCLYSRFS